MELDEDLEDYARATTEFGTNIESIISKFQSLNARGGGKNTADISFKVWEKFSIKHQKSPSHVNNNVQACSRNLRFKSNNNTLALFNKTPPRCSLSKKNLTIITTNHDVFANGWTKYCTLALERAYLFFAFCILVVKFICILICSLVGLYCLIVLHKPTQAFVSRNTQDLIYPFMRALRVTTLPVVRQFSMLTDFYEESCLLSNPFFAMDNLECWPCETARHVIDLTGFSNFSSAYHHSGIPFIVKDAIKTEVGLDDLHMIYSENWDLLEKVFLDSTIPGIKTFDDLFQRERCKSSVEKDLHIKWKINRVTVARLLRKYFPKPYFIPIATEVSVQHYLFVDEVRSKTYALPLTEFANVFLTQASGSRYVVLIPTKNCHHRCKVISTVLQPKDVLFYNWLFWRPVSVHVESSHSNVSVTYLGSFY